jgi:8-oxo-dGTP pyrophosphatase MutT (NUDIX family)
MTEYIQWLRGMVGKELLQLPSVSVALRDPNGRVMLARHAEGDVWVLPGGAVEPGETPPDAALREMFEETGLLVSLTGIVGVFSGPEYVVQYRSGHRASYVMAVFEAVPSAGRWAPDGVEVLDMRFVSEAEAAALPTARWMPEVLQAVFHGKAGGSFRPPTWRSKT